MRTVLITALLLCCVNLFAYHDPNTGRFISRDPIEEDGGLNLYAMVWNNSIDRTDNLGLLSTIPEPEIPPVGPPISNCHGTSMGIVGCKTADDIRSECKACDTDAYSLTLSPCDCTEREVLLYSITINYLWFNWGNGKRIGKGKKEEVDYYHSIGRTIPGEEKSENPPITLNPGIPWETTMGIGGEYNGNVTDPAGHFKKWTKLQKKERFKYLHPQRDFISLKENDIECYCCP